MRPTNPPPQYVVSPAVIWIDYVGPPGSYPTISCGDAVQGRLPPGRLDGKTVIVGDGLPTGDTSRFQRRSPRRGTRAEIVANTLQTILESRYVDRPPLLASAAVVGIAPLGAAAAMGTLRPLAGAGAGALLLLVYVVFATVLFRANRLPDLGVVLGALLATLVLVGGYRYAREELARRRVADLIGRYVPRTVVAELIDRPAEQAAALSDAAARGGGESPSVGTTSGTPSSPAE